MHAGAERSCQPGIAGHHQGEAPRPADPRQILAERTASRLAVVAQYHATQAARQPRYRGAGVGQAPRVGEQPEFRQVRRATVPAGRRTSPGNETSVHGCAYATPVIGGHFPPPAADWH